MHLFNKETLLLLLIASLYFFVTYTLASNQAANYSDWIKNHNPHFKYYKSDLPAHMEAIQMASDGKYFSPVPGLPALVRILKFVTGLDIQSIFPIILSGCNLLTIIGIWYLISSKNPMLGWYVAPCISLCLCLLSALYFPLFSNKIYIGQGSPNIWHNSTYIAIKPLAILTFIGAIDLFYHKNYSNRKLIAFSLITAIGTSVKPSFLIAFFPALIILMGIDGYIKKNLRNMALFFIPSVSFIVWQFVSTYTSSDFSVGNPSADSIVFAPFKVWNLYSSSPIVSVLFAAAFPLFTLCIFRRELDWESKLSWLIFAISLLQFIFLAEVKKFADGNFSWGYSLSMVFIFVSSVNLWLKKWHIYGDLKLVPKDMLLYSTAALMIFLYHTISGIIFLSRLLRGADFYVS